MFTAFIRPLHMYTGSTRHIMYCIIKVATRGPEGIKVATRGPEGIKVATRGP